MILVKIEKNDNGSHNNQTTSATFAPPEGWAVFPDTMDRTNFPFGEVEAELVDGVMTVTKWTPGELPEPEPKSDPEPTAEELLNAMLGVE